MYCLVALWLVTCMVGSVHGWLRHAGCVQWHVIEELHFCRSFIFDMLGYLWE